MYGCEQPSASQVRQHHSVRQNLHVCMRSVRQAASLCVYCMYQPATSATCFRVNEQREQHNKAICLHSDELCISDEDLTCDVQLAENVRIDKVITDMNVEQGFVCHAAQLADVPAMQLVDLVKLSKALHGSFRGRQSWIASVLQGRVTGKAVHACFPSCCSSTAQTSSPLMPAASGCSAARLALREWCAGRSWAFSTGWAA